MYIFICLLHFFLCVCSLFSALYPFFPGKNQHSYDYKSAWIPFTFFFPLGEAQPVQPPWAGPIRRWMQILFTSQNHSLSPPQSQLPQTPCPRAWIKRRSRKRRKTARVSQRGRATEEGAAAWACVRPCPACRLCASWSLQLDFDKSMNK